MATRYSDLDDSNPLDENGLLKDGRKIRVPLQLRDAASSFDNQRTLLVDAASHRPGFRTIVEDGSGSPHDAAAHCHRVLQDEVTKAREEYTHYVQNAWRGEDADDNPVAARERRGANYSNAKAGQSCSIDGAPGRLVRGEDGKLYCRAIRAGDSVTDSRARMYELYDARKAKEYVDPYPDPLDPEDGDFDTDEQAAIETFRQTQAYSNRPNRSAPPRDQRTVDAKTLSKQHQQKMDVLYRQLDAAAEQKWREEF